MFTSVPATYDPYYTLAYEWNGQYTVANSVVGLRALTTATETAANMLRYRPDIAERLAEGDSRIAIIPGNETTKLIPEHAPFAPQKGYGGTIGIPVTSVTENNIYKLGFGENAHPTQNITVHEFAHAIENIGFDAALRSELTFAYNLAMSVGLWADTYAATNEDEYFAEMSNAYFDHEREPDASTNFVNTREELEVYDPLGFALLEKVYGNDTWRDGDWAGSEGADQLTGLETPDFMFGHGGGDQITGNGGDDHIAGGAGDDMIDGGAGMDMATFNAASTAMTLRTFADGRTEATHRDPFGEGQDLLINIEVAAFNDGMTIDLTALQNVAGLSSTDLAAIVELYIAYFNRAPDAMGLYFWGDAFAEGTTLPQMAAFFIDQVETRVLYPATLSNADFATAVYNNVLGRVPDQAGFDFWVSTLNSGAVGRDTFILAVLDGAKAPAPPDVPPEFVTQQQADQKYLADKTDIGGHFAVTNGYSDVADANAVMALFDGSEQSISSAVGAIAGLAPDLTDIDTGGLLMPLVGVFDDPFLII